jgi:hypothetical protein
MQPRAKRIAWAQCPCPPNQDEKGRLKRIVNVGFRTEHPPARAQDHGPMPGDDRLEGDLIPIL